MPLCPLPVFTVRRKCVIPSCAVTGEAAGLAAAWQARHGEAPGFARVQSLVTGNGGLLRPELFDRVIE